MHLASLWPTILSEPLFVYIYCTLLASKLISILASSRIYPDIGLDKLTLVIAKKVPN